MTISSHSLTPASSSDAIIYSAATTAMINSLLTLPPTLTTLHFAMKNKSFVKSTTASSRTALIVMPALFVFSLTSEHGINGLKREESAKRTAAIENLQREGDGHKVPVKILEKVNSISTSKESPLDSKQPDTSELTALLFKAEFGNPVTVVPSDEEGNISFTHRSLNFLYDNPFKFLGAIATPLVASIFITQNAEKYNHLKFSQKVMQTRVLGQAGTVGLLLSLMAYKTYMDDNGRFVSQNEANILVNEAKQRRVAMLKMLDEENERKEVYSRLRAERKKKLDEENSRLKLSDVEVGGVEVIATSSEKEKKKEIEVV